MEITENVKSLSEKRKLGKKVKIYEKMEISFENGNLTKNIRSFFIFSNYHIQHFRFL